MIEQTGFEVSIFVYAERYVSASSFYRGHQTKYVLFTSQSLSVSVSAALAKYDF